MNRILSDELKNNINDIIFENINIKVYAIYIFGSFGTKFEREDSDIDIAIITDSKLSLRERYKLKTALEDKLDKDIDLSILNEYNSSLMMSVLSNGSLIYESYDYNLLFDEIYENLEFDFYFLNCYEEEINKYV